MKWFAEHPETLYSSNLTPKTKIKKNINKKKQCSKVFTKTTKQLCSVVFKILEIIHVHIL